MKDIQSLEDHRKTPIQKVGITNLKYPAFFEGLSGKIHPVASTWDLSVSLDADKKGTHMSRFVEIIHEMHHTLSVSQLTRILKMMQDRLHAKKAFVRIGFAYFVEKKSPITEHSSYLDYNVQLEGSANENSTAIALTVEIPVTTLCPSSKLISEFGAHNQRGIVSIRITPTGDISFEELISYAEASASSELYAIVKREDEKFVTEKAYENPAFVEDLVRDVALHLRKDDRISNFRVQVTNFESIHNHDAYAVIEG